MLQKEYNKLKALSNSGYKFSEGQSNKILSCKKFGHTAATDFNLHPNTLRNAANSSLALQIVNNRGTPSDVIHDLIDKGRIPTNRPLDDSHVEHILKNESDLGDFSRNNYLTEKQNHMLLDGGHDNLDIKYGLLSKKSTQPSVLSKLGENYGFAGVLGHENHTPNHLDKAIDEENNKKFSKYHQIIRSRHMNDARTSRIINNINPEKMSSTLSSLGDIIKPEHLREAYNKVTETPDEHTDTATISIARNEKTPGDVLHKIIKSGTEDNGFIPNLPYKSSNFSREHHDAIMRNPNISQDTKDWAKIKSPHSRNYELKEIVDRNSVYAPRATKILDRRNGYDDLLQKLNS